MHNYIVLLVLFLSSLYLNCPLSTRFRKPSFRITEPSTSIDALYRNSGNNPMVGATVACAVLVEEALKA